MNNEDSALGRGATEGVVCLCVCYVRTRDLTIWGFSNHEVAVMRLEPRQRSEHARSRLASDHLGKAGEVLHGHLIAGNKARLSSSSNRPTVLVYPQLS